MSTYKKKDFLEFVRLTLISDVFTVSEVHQILISLINEEDTPDIKLIDAIMSNDKDSILMSLEELTKDKYDPLIVECLMASELLEQLNTAKLKLERTASILYLQLIDEKTHCWQKNLNQIMKLDDGFRLASQSIIDKHELSRELIVFLKEKARQCISIQPN